MIKIYKKRNIKIKKLLFVIFSQLLLTNLSPAPGKMRLTLGPTISYFVNTENTSPDIGISVGIMKDFLMYNKFLLSVGIGFASRGAILENRTIAPYASQPTDAYYQDIHGMLGYIDIPANIQYEILFFNKIKFKPFIGPMFTFPVVDLTRFEKREFFNVYTPSQSNLLNYDFWFEEDSGHKSYIEAGLLSLKATTAGFNFGFQIGYKKYALEVRYVLDGRNVYQFDSLSEVRYKMHSMYVLIYF